MTVFDEIETRNVHEDPKRWIEKDYIDLRTIDVLLRNLFVPEIMTDDYKFSDSGLYYSVAVDDAKPQGSWN